MTDSIYDQLNAYGTVAKQRFVENFSGSALDTDRWNTTLGGSGSVSMADEVDGGLLVDASSTSGGSATINFNLIKPFSPSSSKLIYVAKINEVGTNAFESYAGLGTINTIGGGVGSFTYLTSSNGNWQLATTNGAWKFSASTTPAVSDTYTVFEHILQPSTVELKINGVTAMTNTDKLPDEPLQPMLGINTSSANSKHMNISYIEAYNT